MKNTQNNSSISPSPINQVRQPIRIDVEMHERNTPINAHISLGQNLEIKESGNKKQELIYCKILPNDNITLGKNDKSYTVIINP